MIPIYVSVKYRKRIVIPKYRVRFSGRVVLLYRGVCNALTFILGDR